MSRFVRADVEIVVASCGGVGTTFLIDFLSKYKKVNHSQNSDKLKHLSIPPVSFRKFFKIVYVWGNPVDSVVSIFRRNYQQHLSIHLQSYNRIFYRILPKEMTLEQYVRVGKDRFLFKKNYLNWHNKYLACPTLFISYEKIWDYLPQLFAFLDIPLTEINRFPPKKIRASDVSSLDLALQASLKNWYKEEVDFFLSLPDFEICMPPEKRFSLLLTIRFTLAVFWKLLDEVKILLRRSFPCAYQFFLAKMKLKLSEKNFRTK